MKDQRFSRRCGEEKQRESEEKDADGNRGAERPVVNRAEKGLHDVGDHGAGRAADEQRREKIAEGENESEGGPREKAGHRERKNHAEKSGRGAGAEILRGFDERARNVFERGVDGEEDEGRVNVREHEDDGEGAVEEKADGLVSDVGILEEAVEDAFAAENCFPGVAANEIADPERHDDELIEQFLARAGMKREVIGKGIAEKQGTEHDGAGDAHGAEENFGVEGIREQLLIIVEIPVMDDGRRLARPRSCARTSARREAGERAPTQRSGGAETIVL